MRIAPSIELTVEQQTTLEEWAGARSLPARVVERARIVLLAAAGEQDKEIARPLGMTPKNSPAGASASWLWACRG